MANALGVRKLVTNAAGSLNPAFDPGDVLMITDHMNFTGHNPLIGPHADAFGVRFPDMSDAYDNAVQEHIRQAFDKNALPLREGIYAGITGPSLETSAERRFLRQLARCGGHVHCDGGDCGQTMRVSGRRAFCHFK